MRRKWSWGVLYVVSFFIILLAYFPHLQSGMQQGHDDWFHLHRIYALASELRQGIFPVKIHHLAGYGYGYGVGFFYSNFFLYIPALFINVFHMPLDIAYRLFVLIIYVAIYASMFYCIYQLTDKKECAFLGASIYLFTNKVMEAFYITLGLGQIFAFIFFPMAIIGMYLFLEREKSTFLLMFGFIGLIYSHTISTFMAFVICFILVIFNLKTVVTDMRKMFQLVISVGITLLVTVSFWLPMLEQMRAQILKVKIPWTTSEENVLKIGDIVKSESGLGYTIVILLIFNIIMLGNSYLRKEKEGEYKFLLISIAVVMLTMCEPFWHFMNTDLNIRFLQFPDRLLAPITTVIIVDTVLILREFKIETFKGKYILLMVVVCCIILSYHTFIASFLNVGDEHINKVINNEIAAFGAGEEWLPIETDREEILDANFAFDNDGNRVIGEKKKGYTRFVFTADLEKEYYDLPYIWYKGYGAVDAYGNEFEFSKNRETGMLQIHMPDDAEGTTQIEVYYKGTKYQKLAYFANCIGIVLLIAYLITLKKDNDILFSQIKKFIFRNKE